VGQNALNPRGFESENFPMARILVIDDDLPIGHVVRTILEAEGHEVLLADDGNRGFATAQRQTPDAILLDVMMPAMSGVAVLRALIGDHRTVRIPVVVLSALAADEVQQECRDLGVSGYLQKPIDPDTLIREIARVTVSHAA